MPLYDYKCSSCARVTEVRHGFNETNAQRCPTCGGELKRVYNAAPILFKGSGFYINDSRPKPAGDKPAAAAAAAPAPKEAAAGASAGESSGAAPAAAVPTQAAAPPTPSQSEPDTAA